MTYQNEFAAYVRREFDCPAGSIDADINKMVAIAAEIKASAERLRDMIDGLEYNRTSLPTAWPLEGMILDACDHLLNGWVYGVIREAMEAPQPKSFLPVAAEIAGAK